MKQYQTTDYQIDTNYRKFYNMVPC
jgi:hypothetical protein